MDSSMEQTQSTLRRAALGGDHDLPFVRFQRYHFSTRQLARLLVLRGESQDSRSEWPTRRQEEENHVLAVPA
jgi:hypothetical protein